MAQPEKKIILTPEQRLASLRTGTGSHTYPTNQGCGKYMWPPFPRSQKKWQVSSSGGSYPLWRKDGKELFYLGLDGKLMSVEVKLGLGLETGVPRVLFSVPGPMQPWPGPYCATGDGKRFIILEPGEEPRTPFTVVLNWAAGLKRYIQFRGKAFGSHRR
jgi:hypothetical protein